MGPHKDREKLCSGWGLNPRPSGDLRVRSPLLYRLSYKVRREQAVGTEDVKHWFIWGTKLALHITLKSVKIVGHSCPFARQNNSQRFFISICSIPTCFLFELQWIKESGIKLLSFILNLWSVQFVTRRKSGVLYGRRCKNTLTC